MSREYRIVSDRWAGFEVQARRWWFPFWLQCRGQNGHHVNTHKTIEDAEAFAQRHAQYGGGVIKYLGRL